jgi:glutamyl-tRNA synthetase
MDVTALKDAVAPFIAADLGLDVEQLRQDPRLLALTPLIQERIKLLTEATALIDWAFLPAEQITYPDPTQLIGKKLTAAQSIEVLEVARELIATVEPFEAATLEAAFRSRAEAMNIKLGSFLTPVRVAVTGKAVSPPLFESIQVIGREETLKRLRNAIQALTAYAVNVA